MPRIGGKMSISTHCCIIHQFAYCVLLLVTRTSVTVACMNVFSQKHTILFPFGTNK